jgi:hypothetical protein
MLHVEVKLKDGTIHIIKDEESDNNIFREIIKYDTTNHFFRDVNDIYVSARQVTKFQFIEEQSNG